ncbi:MAG: hypothetical protein M1817_006576 [Caeruleum heppii]|nr:MAG: hypothetical protein M1817_006576 [Caeruleum heppii]
MPTRPPASRSDAPPTGSVRRNLFHHHLSRRPTPTSTTNPTIAGSTTTSATTLQPSPPTRDENPIADAESADIVVRDRNGEVAVGTLMVGREEGEEGGEEGKEDARLSEAVKHHCRDRNRAPSEPAELFAAVQASLRAKVASLQEDDWMFEGENEQ